MCLFRSFDHFLIRLFIFLLSFKRFLCILLNSPLSDRSFANTFFPNLWLIVSFSLQCLHTAEVFNFNEVQLTTFFFFYGSGLWCYTWKSLPWPRTSRFSPVLSSSSVIVWCFILRAVIHSELIFVKGIGLHVGFCFFFICLLFACRYLVPYIEKTILSPLN